MPILKPIYYSVMSTKLAKKVIQIGRVKTDGRAHVLLPLISGGGKSKIKNAARDVLPTKAIGEPTSLHSEQLVGKTIPRTNKTQTYYEKIAGYFSLDFLLLEESYQFWTSDDTMYDEARKYLRTAVDVYGNNLVTKKGVDIPFAEALSYYPHLVVVAFIQPLPLPDVRVYDGDTRRFLIPYVDFHRIDRREALRERVTPGNVRPEFAISEFTQFYNDLPDIETFTLSPDAIRCFTYASELLVDYGFQYNEKIAFYTNYKQFTIQEFLLKISAILAYVRGKNEVTERDVRLAYCDLLETLSLEFDFIDRHVIGSLNYGTGFKGAKGKDQECLRWLYSQGATSEVGTQVTVAQYLDQIKTLFGVEQRQAQRILTKHGERRWVGSGQKGQHSSKTWLAFSPEFLSPSPHYTFREIYAAYREWTEVHDTPGESRTSIGFPGDEPNMAGCHP